MKISTKGRYGLRCMLDLAVNSNGDQVSIKSIADRQNISENYLEQVFSALRKSGIVKSVKGAQGGYILSADAADIKVSDILRTLEGTLDIADENSANEKNLSDIDKLIADNVWDKLNNEIKRITDSITLEDLINENNRLNGINNYIYYL